MTLRLTLAAVAVLACNLPAMAETKKGPVTGLEMPRYVSMKAGEGNVRRGPSRSHRIDWVYKRRGLPLRVTAEHEHWRRVVDRDGMGGWVHYSLITGTRTVIVEEDMLPLRARPEADATIRAQLQENVIAVLTTCDGAWCRLKTGGFSGWARRDALWGVD